MNVTLKKEGLKNPLRSMPCWHINEKNNWPIDVNIQRPLWLEGETNPLSIDRDKGHP
jgi:hypothetical protein